MIIKSQISQRVFNAFDQIWEVRLKNNTVLIYGSPILCRAQQTNILIQENVPCVFLLLSDKTHIYWIGLDIRISM